MHIVCYLPSRVRVMHAGRLEKHSVAHDGCLFVIHDQRLALIRELFSVHTQKKSLIS